MVMHIAHIVHDPPHRLIPDQVGTITSRKVVVSLRTVSVYDRCAQIVRPLREVRQQPDPAAS